MCTSIDLEIPLMTEVSVPAGDIVADSMEVSSSDHGVKITESVVEVIDGYASVHFTSST